MKRAHSSQSTRRGATLVEAIIAIGVLAVAIPLVFGAIAEGGKSGMSSQAETRSTWMVRACIAEIQASREGHPCFLPVSTNGQAFPTDTDVWALAFSKDGRPIGRLSKAAYDSGTSELDGKPVRYIAAMSAKPVGDADSAALALQIDIEYPAAAEAGKRDKLHFHSRIP